MGSSIVFQYPVWYIAICILFAAFVTGLIYFKSPNWKGHPTWITALLGTSRFLAVFIVAVLLLGPLLRLTETHVQPPVVAILHDNSESVLSSFSEADSIQYVEAIKTLESTLSNDYTVEVKSFGSEVRSDFDFRFEDKETNIYEALTQVFEQYGDQNLGAVILATDGIFNKGGNPLYLRTGMTAPIYPVALGDTTVQRDIIVRNAFANQIAYLGDRFKIETDIAGRFAAGNRTNITVHHITGGQRILQSSQSLDIETDDFFKTLDFTIDAARPGLQRYQISASPITGEQNLANNTRDVFVNVLDSRQKILLLGHSPHPDVAAIRSAVESNQNFEFEVIYPDGQTNIAFDGYDLVILHQFPSNHPSWPDLSRSIEQSGLPVLYIRGQQTNLSALRDAQSLITMPRISGSTNEVQAIWNSGFGLFSMSEDARRMIPRFPPLHSAFGEFEAGPAAHVSMYQRIGNVETSYPLLALGEVGGVRNGVIFGEGIWRWRLFNFAQTENHLVFNEIIEKTIQYLTLKEDRRRFRLSMSNNLLSETEPVIIHGELYNPSYELVNSPEVSVTITDEEGREYVFSMDRTSDAYVLQAGFLPVGDYRYRGSVTLGGQQLNDQGIFSIQPVQLEQYITVANHNVLQQLAAQSGGQVFYPDQISKITDAIHNRGDVKPMMYQTASTLPVIHFHWIFFIVLLLLSLEWFVRRYRSAY